MPDVEWLSIEDRGITKFRHEHLAGLKRLKRLSVDGKNVTAEGFRVLGELPSLERLDLALHGSATRASAHVSWTPESHGLELNKTPISDGGLQHLAGMNKLTHLTITSTAIGDEGFRHLAGLRNLERLDAAETRITGKALCRSAE